MKLNFDIVRDTLLEIESTDSINSDIIYDPAKVDKDIIYALLKLHEAGMINCHIHEFDNGISLIRVDSLTWDGHNFLDNIRNDGIWSKTKTIANKVSAKSFEAFVQISSNVISQVIINELNK